MFFNGFKPLFAPFRYAPLHKEGFKNCKQYLVLKLNCKFETGLTNKKCKLFLGRVRKKPHPHCSTFANPHEPTLKPKVCKRAAILLTHPGYISAAFLFCCQFIVFYYICTLIFKLSQQIN